MFSSRDLNSQTSIALACCLTLSLKRRTSLLFLRPLESSLTTKHESVTVDLCGLRFAQAAAPAAAAKQVWNRCI